MPVHFAHSLRPRSLYLTDPVGYNVVGQWAMAPDRKGPATSAAVASLAEQLQSGASQQQQQPEAGLGPGLGQAQAWGTGGGGTRSPGGGPGRADLLGKSAPLPQQHGQQRRQLPPRRLSGASLASSVRTGASAQADARHHRRGQPPSLGDYLEVKVDKGCSPTHYARALLFFHSERLAGQCSRCRAA